MAGRMKKFSENTFTISEVMDSSTLNLRLIFSPHVGMVVDDQELFRFLIC